MVKYSDDPAAGETATPSGLGAGKYVNVAAAALSVALIGGVGVWGYKLLVRDVTGIPVVRAMQGDMRVAPENPGGEIAAHVGLSVNSVPADGGAAEPEDRLILAPSQVNLQAEDMAVAPVLADGRDETPAAEAGEVVAAGSPEIADPLAQSPTPAALTDDADDGADAVAAVAATSEPSGPLSAEDVLALADQIASGSEPMGALAEGEDVPVAVAVNGVTVDPDVIPDAVPGVRRSPRPSSRPARRVAPAAAPAASTPAPQAPAQVTTAAIPEGTKLVQLGAFDSPDIAANEWARLTGRFPEFFDGKDQVIQEAKSGGRTFFRLRATGFADLSDARRFCSAMSAEGAPCIPVVVR
ncbi:SPOR domain-containing protein [Thalassorhabdomicrobium marinisediminis]|uniref:SPOR domain-containing protein n=1 Tax=Thalassorhabdomicrobium marinisediminis TaxID=2170577 RepID=A0A2T7G0Z8_9RHOB|nr:SPOR domain-containing protein [Thalassorhabdomicrobium marinisediminis]PVA08103.1 SPOR domain-containing protein [Thalassorhabdomicrobium marinisediminis]